MNHNPGTIWNHDVNLTNQEPSKDHGLMWQTAQKTVYLVAFSQKPKQNRLVILRKTSKN